MDRQSVYSLSVLPPDYDNNEDTRGQIQSQLEQFILQFRLDNAFIYRLVISSAETFISNECTEIKFEKMFL